MKKPMVKVVHISADSWQFGLCVLSIAFLVGGLLGTQLVATADIQKLGIYLTAFVTRIQEMMTAQPTLTHTIWSLFRWSIFTFLMGFTPLGMSGIPLLFSLRGGLLCFSVGAFVQLYGGKGALLAFIAFGLTAMIELPTLFYLGIQSFAAARDLAIQPRGRTHGMISKGAWVQLGLSLLALISCVLLEYSAVIPLLQEAVQLLF